MTTRNAAGVRLHRLTGLGLLVALVGVAVWQAAVHATAWSNFRRGKDALAGDDPAEALRRFERGLDTWTGYAEGHFLAARAARRASDLPAARRHLDESARLGWARAAIDVEEALLRARSGDLAWGAEVLLRAAHEDHPDTPEILPLLVPAYLADFRLLEAESLTAKWVELRPAEARAWAYRGDILERLGRKSEAIDALRRAVELTPDDRQARLNLARLLVQMRRGEGEASKHLEALVAADPTDPAALAQLAACRDLQGRTDEAVALLDRVLAVHPRDARSLHLRGRLDLNHGRAGTAVGFLRRAAEVDPSDREILYALFIALQQAGTPAEVRAAEERWKQCDADLKRVSDLGRSIVTNPNDPDLRREMGELFLRNGREADGIRWLQTALDIDPGHAPAHNVLAAHYDRMGRTDLAAKHRAAAKSGPR